MAHHILYNEHEFSNDSHILDHDLQNVAPYVENDAPSFFFVNNHQEV